MDQVNAKRSDGRRGRSIACRHSPAYPLAAALAALALLHGCASSPPGTSRPSRDGAPSQPQRNLEQVKDAEPRVEVVRAGGPNKPYYVLGRWYTPQSGDAPFEERGLASWYGTKFHGLATSSGEPYDMYSMTAAHPTLPIPSYARVRNPANGREIIVRINDRGPFHPGRIVDLSYTGAYKLGLLRGVAPVELQRITFDEIRAGSWKRTPAQEETRLAAPNTSSTPLAAALSSSTTGTAALATSAPASASLQVPTDPTPAPAVATSEAVTTPVVSASPEAPAELPMMPSPPTSTSTSASTSTQTQAQAQAQTQTQTQTQTSSDTARGFWVQLGAFRQRLGAEALQRRTVAELHWIEPLLSIFSDRSLFRLQAGPYADHDEAQRAGRSLNTTLGLSTLIVERR